MTRSLLVTMAVVEVGAGVALALAPSVAAVLLLGSPLDSATAVLVGRVAGVALCSLGVACWLARHDAESRAAITLVAAMWVYNTAVAVLLIYAGVVGLRGPALWPAVLVHLAMALWCIGRLAAAR